MNKEKVLAVEYYSFINILFKIHFHVSLIKCNEKQMIKKYENSDSDTDSEEPKEQKKKISYNKDKCKEISEVTIYKISEDMGLSFDDLKNKYHVSLANHISKDQGEIFEFLVDLFHGLK